MTAAARPAEEVRHRLLTVLGRPLSTAQLRDRINTATATPTHHEEVYRNLLVLENRRRVARQEVTGRNVTLGPAGPAPAAERPRAGPGRHL
jgi:hypothetical protein